LFHGNETREKSGFVSYVSFFLYFDFDPKYSAVYYASLPGHGIPISEKPPWEFPKFPGIPNRFPGIPGIRAGTGDRSYRCFLSDLAYFKTYGLLASYRSVTQRLGTWVYATQPQ
jgi:hypothetical protein